MGGRPVTKTLVLSLFERRGELDERKKTNHFLIPSGASEKRKKVGVPPP